MVAFSPKESIMVQNILAFACAIRCSPTPGITRRPAPLKADDRQRVGGRVHAFVRCAVAGALGISTRDTAPRAEAEGQQEEPRPDQGKIDPAPPGILDHRSRESQSRRDEG
jgi:hypothetical protein